MKDMKSFWDLIDKNEFRFDRLDLDDIDNLPVFKVNAPDIAEQEICLFHREISSADEYFRLFHNRIMEAIENRTPLPCVRFADGEYAFYRKSLACNGLYQQSESVDAIESALPDHISALRALVSHGILCPLVFPGNINPGRGGIFSFFRKNKGDGSALGFLEFLGQNKIFFGKDNYAPFYLVYAYLTSEQFVRSLDGKRVCIISSEFNEEACQRWFSAKGSSPGLCFVEIPDSFVATRWGSIKEGVIRKIPMDCDLIPMDCDLFLVGAGIGSLLVCVDVSQVAKTPVIDAGHVLNMINGRVDKSAGPRLYTIRK
jgi:hypothetical protein